jgi:hypothetical protein
MIAFSGHLTHTIYLDPPVWVGDEEINYVIKRYHLPTATHPAQPRGKKICHLIVRTNNTRKRQQKYLQSNIFNSNS